MSCIEKLLTLRAARRNECFWQCIMEYTEIHCPERLPVSDIPAANNKPWEEAFLPFAHLTWHNRGGLQSCEDCCRQHSMYCCCDSHMGQKKVASTVMHTFIPTLVIASFRGGHFPILLVEGREEW